jgi:hypothetical protein
VRRLGILMVGVLTGLIMTIGVAVAAPPGSDVSTTKRVSGSFSAESSDHYQYYVEISAELRTQQSLGGSSEEMWIEVYVAVEDPDGNPVDECYDNGFADPSLMEVFEDDLSEAFLHGDFNSGCFWGTILIDVHWYGEGRLLSGNGHQRDPGSVCSSHYDVRTARIHANFGFTEGPEGYVDPYAPGLFDDMSSPRARARDQLPTKSG